MRSNGHSRPNLIELGWRHLKNCGRNRFDYDPFRPAVDVTGPVAHKASQGQTEFAGQIDCQTARRRDSSQNRDPPHHRFLRQFKAQTAADDKDRRPDTILTIEQQPTKEFIDRVVPANIFAHGQQVAVRGRQSGTV